MKKLSAIIILICAPMVSHAEGLLNNAVLGVAIIHQDAEIEVSGNGGSASSTENGTGIGIYLDKYEQQKYRYNGTFSFISYDNFDITDLVLSADYLLPVNHNVTFFGGAAFGGAIQKYSDASLGDAALGAVYGVQVGGIAYMSENFILEAGYRFRPTKLETEVDAPSGTLVTVSDLSSTYLSLQLKF